MATLLTVGLSINESSAPAASLALAVYVEPSGDELALDVTPHVAAPEVFARSGERQSVRLTASASIAPFGVTIEPQAIEWGLEVGAGGRGSIALPASSGDWLAGPLGYETSFGGPPPGAAEVSVSMTYGSDASLVIPLAEGAVAAQSSRSLSPSGHLMTINFLDYSGRSDGEAYDYALPAYHGKRPSEMIAEMAAIAGVPSERIALPAFGPILQKSFESLGTGWLGRARDLASSFGYMVDFDAAGVLTAYPWPPDHDAPAEAVFGLSNFAAASEMNFEADASAPRCIKILGSAPEIAGGGGVVSFPPIVTETLAPFSIPRAAFIQNPGGALVSTGLGMESEGLKVVERTEIRRTKHGTCLLREETLTYRWFAPKAARYHRLPNGTIEDIGSALTGPTFYIYDPLAVAGDSADAYLWPEHQFVLVAREITEWTFNGSGGALTQKISVHGGWYNETAAIKTRTDPDDDFTALPYLDSYIEGNGRTVLGWAETFRSGLVVSPATSGDWLAREWFTYQQDSGYKVAEQEEDVLIGRIPGFESLYSDGSMWRSAAEELSVQKILRIQYIGNGPGAHVSLTSTYDAAGKLTSRVRADADGYLPAIEVCDPVLDAERSARPFEAEVCAIYSSGTGRTEIVTNDYVETEAQAHDLAAWELRRRRAISVKGAIPAWGAGRPGLPVLVSMPRQGLPGLRGWVHSVRHSKGGAQEPLLSEVELRVEV